MMETERHALKLGITTLYLGTHDKQAFYEHVGYELCQPVVSLGSASTLLSCDKFAQLLEKMSPSCCEEKVDKSKSCCEDLVQASSSHLTCTDHDESSSENNTKSCRDLLGSDQSAAAIAPPLPPPPLPPLPVKYSGQSEPCCSIWMKKDISNIITD